MKLLLDTHVFIWLVEGNPKLSMPAQTAFGDPLKSLYLSVASVWEMAIKIGSKKLALTDPLDSYIAKWTVAYQIAVLPIDLTHALSVMGMPDHHRDPFDRILIAQVMVEMMTLVSADAKFTPYSVPILW
jgi:PIN domain nuclease of toxin-antitoxin system